MVIERDDKLKGTERNGDMGGEGKRSNRMPKRNKEGQEGEYVAKREVR